MFLSDSNNIQKFNVYTCISWQNATNASVVSQIEVRSETAAAWRSREVSPIYPGSIRNLFDTNVGFSKVLNKSRTKWFLIENRVARSARILDRKSRSVTEIPPSRKRHQAAEVAQYTEPRAAQSRAQTRRLKIPRSSGRSGSSSGSSSDGSSGGCSPIRVKTETLFPPDSGSRKVLYVTPSLYMLQSFSRAAATAGNVLMYGACFMVRVIEWRVTWFTYVLRYSHIGYTAPEAAAAGAAAAAAAATTSRQRLLGSSSYRGQQQGRSSNGKGNRSSVMCRLVDLKRPVRFFSGVT